MFTLQCDVLVPSHHSISVTPWYQVGVGQSRMYAMPYFHIAAYAAIALPKGTFWSHSRNVMVPPNQCISVMP